MTLKNRIILFALSLILLTIGICSKDYVFSGFCLAMCAVKLKRIFQSQKTDQTPDNRQQIHQHTKEKRTETNITIGFCAFHL